MRGVRQSHRWMKGGREGRWNKRGIAANEILTCYVWDEVSKEWKLSLRLPEMTDDLMRNRRADLQGAPSRYSDTLTLCSCFRIFF